METKKKKFLINSDECFAMSLNAEIAIFLNESSGS